MSNGSPDEELDAHEAEDLLETARHRRPPADDPVAALLSATTFPDVARVGRGEEAAVAAFRAAGRSEARFAAPVKSTGRRLLKSFGIAAAAALTLAGAAFAADRTGMPLPFSHATPAHAPSGTPSPLPTGMPTSAHGPHTWETNHAQPPEAPSQNVPRPHSAVRTQEVRPSRLGKKLHPHVARPHGPKRGHSAARAVGLKAVPKAVTMAVATAWYTQRSGPRMSPDESCAAPAPVP
ncbi:hypothetical protein [Actinacidiphila rubida]|uniref:Uncharacterized protein n=1 Tax=Actinacidiphila rubida TaxID=310780 RepID=A0A1H8SK88_9ACTN|nr:hypothetical protein [Actinacidiphila rubida]SEO79051.1 hypothetical protein SAMN05216267_104328 [Actinacidiphila rubida]